jgi:hypothetical protein
MRDRNRKRLRMRLMLMSESMINRERWKGNENEPHNGTEI